jgi:cell division protein ZapB
MTTSLMHAPTASDNAWWHTDSRKRAGIVSAMTTSDPVQHELAALAEQVDRLLDTVRRLTDENRSLRQSQEQLSGERAGLLARNEQARSRVEAMIQRLRSLENNG